MKPKLLDHFEIAQRYVRACGPVTMEAIAGEIRKQVPGANHTNCEELARKAISRGINRGWLIRYDNESYIIA